MIEKNLGGHYHPVHAKAALRGLLVDECLLERMWMGYSAKTFQRGDASILYGTYCHAARTDGDAVDDDGAGSALRETAAKSGTLQTQFIPEHVQERHVWININHSSITVYLK
jgi:hypothetical protein